VAAQIKDVWQDNFEEELAIISSLVSCKQSDISHVSFDTEFAGFADHAPNQGIYERLRQNVSCLKIIQLGITLADSNGNMTTPTSTWQFNLVFNLKKDAHQSESIDLLIKAGLDLNKHAEHGIPATTFSELFARSGLINNPALTWVAFNARFDFGYLVSLLMQKPLPSSLDLFLQQCS